MYHFGVVIKPVEKNAVNGQAVIKLSDFSQTQMIELAGEWSFF
jgi:hypothetical protein